MNKAKIVFEKISIDKAKRALPTWTSKSFKQPTKSGVHKTVKGPVSKATPTKWGGTWRPKDVLIPKVVE